jgi:hypothetical protein
LYLKICAEDHKLLDPYSAAMRYLL